MINTFYKYFIPEDLIKKKCRSDFAYISEIAKSKLVVTLVFILIFAVLPVFIYRFFVMDDYTMSLFVVLLTPIIFLGALLYFRKTGNYQVALWLTYISFLVILPIRTFYSGGLTSPNLSWFLSGAVVIGILHKTKSSLIFYILSLIEILILHFMDAPPYNSPPGLRYFVHFNAYLIIVASILSLLKVNKIVIKENKKLEQSKTIHLMIASLSHEINNPLAIGLGYLDQIQEKDESLKIQKIRSSLIRIKEIVRKISELENAKKIQTTSYGPDDHILKLD